MSQRPFLPPPSFASPVSFNLSQLAFWPRVDGRLAFRWLGGTELPLNICYLPCCRWKPCPPRKRKGGLNAELLRDRLEFAGAGLYFNRVGKTYLYECPQCQYRVKISGGADKGLHCEIQTVICRDCRELYDVFKRQRRRADANKLVKFPGFYRPDIPPVVLGASSVNPSLKPPAPLVWQDTEPACPVEPKHFVEPWNDPGRCPRCGNFMEKNGFPFRAWD